MTEKDRLLAIMAGEKMSSGEFAKQIGISPATLSNIANGRNNPSLEILQKAADRFRIVSSDWLFMGIGPMYRQSPEAPEQLLFDVRPEDLEQAPAAQAVASSRKQAAQPVTVEKFIEKKITKIVVFYEDGTFAELTN